MRLLDHLLRAIRGAAVFNPEVEVAPVCILWPDHDRQWADVIPAVQGAMPELLVLGDYAPDRRAGPAIWLRCVIAGIREPRVLQRDAELDRVISALRESTTPAKAHVPVLYLPGVSRQDLRAVESCPEHLKPLAELQYQGVIWSQINAKDWTIRAFLKSDQGGLGLDVAQDNDSRHAMQLALYRLLDADVALLKGKRLDRDYFNTLLTSGDPIRDLLEWLDQGEEFLARRDENAWKAFIEVCKSQLAFNPQADGLLAGAELLANHAGPWEAVWVRYCEAPGRYPNIPSQIRKCRPPMDDILWHTCDGAFDGWPQWNEAQEAKLQHELIALAKTPARKARAKIKSLEQLHARRRTLVWAELGEAPLACAVEHLAILAENAKGGLAAGTVDDLVAGYCTDGWRVDDAVMRALAAVEHPAELEAVTAAIRAVYLPWAEESARHLQKIWIGPGAPLVRTHDEVGDAECVLFVDGLRFDCAKRLAAALAELGCVVDESTCWAALPSVTGTGKPAVAPLKAGSDFVQQEPEGYNFELMPAHRLRKAIEESGFQYLSRGFQLHSDEYSIQKTWCEFGDIDHEGHDRGWKLAKQLDNLIREIRDRVAELLEAGWKRVRVVTDHGWLLLPGGLPKIELPSALAVSRWGRCASLKPGASTQERLYPWYWNPTISFALADGVSCFRNGNEYAHGGLSLQECLTLQLAVSRVASAPPSGSVVLTDVVWKGLRCKVRVEGDVAGLLLDVRTQPGDGSTSVVFGTRPLKRDGTGSVVVEDEDLEGREATMVLIDAAGTLVAQVGTVIGGGTA